MTTLDLNVLEEEVSKAEKRNLWDVCLPEGMEQKQFDKFIKLMNCNSSKALASVTLEDIVDLLSDCDAYAACLIDGEAMIRARQEVVERAHSASVYCRRVL